MTDIKKILGFKNGVSSHEVKKALGSPLYNLNVRQVIAIAKALDKSYGFVIDAAQFGGEDLIMMSEDDYNMWMKRLATEPLTNDVRRNLSWAIGRGLEIPKIIEYYLDNHPEKRLRKTRLSPYQYKLVQEERNRAIKAQQDKSSSTDAL